MIVIDIVIWADLEAAAAGEAAWLAPERSVKMYNLLPRRVREVHVKTPDVSNIDMDWWSDLVQITFQNHKCIWCNSLSPLWLYKPENLASKD